MTGSELVKYDAACRAIADAKATDEAKDIRDKAIALRAYARQAKNRDLEIDAAEIRMRAERRLGELIAMQKATVGLADGGDAQRTRFRPGTESRPTLAGAGIDKKLSSRAQKLAAVPEDRFEGLVAEARNSIACTRNFRPIPSPPPSDAAEDKQNYRTAFLLRVDQAIGFAFYTGPSTREIVAAARAAAAAWSTLAQNLENSS